MPGTAWGEWDECTQIRRPAPDRIELRRSTPACMLTACLLSAAGLDVAFFGKLLPQTGLLHGLVLFAASVPVFFVGRGVEIDGRTRRVRRWWGLIHRPVLVSDREFGAYRALSITEKLGPKHGPNVGRTLCHPVWLLPVDGSRVLLKPVPWPADARELAAEIGVLMSLPVEDRIDRGQAAEVA
jgi:hypothetical protein